jgi:ATP-dependent DNA helicase
MYHGSPAERAELRRTVMALPSKGDANRSPVKAKRKSRLPAKSKSKPKPKLQPANKPTKSADLTNFFQPKGGPRRSGRFKKAVHDDQVEELEEGDELENAMELDGDGDAVKTEEDDEAQAMSSFPVVLTTYEMIIKDRVHLSNYNWGYIVVDEGHRLKNLNCKLIKEIKKYTSAGRMILTGTPLHVCILLYVTDIQILTRLCLE